MCVMRGTEYKYLFSWTELHRLDMLMRRNCAMRGTSFVALVVAPGPIRRDLIFPTKGRIWVFVIN
jgi:hypothetical protein